MPRNTKTHAIAEKHVTPILRMPDINSPYKNRYAPLVRFAGHQFVVKNVPASSKVKAKARGLAFLKSRAVVTVNA